MQTVTFFIKPSAVRRQKIVWLAFPTVFFALAASDFISFIRRADYGPVGEFLLPPGYELWLHGLSAAILVAAGAVSVRVAVRAFRHGSTNESFLLLDDNGLTYRWLGSRAYWQWHELSEFRIAEFAFSGRKCIVIASSGSEDRSGRAGTRGSVKPPGGRRPTRFFDYYDASLEDIAAKLNECRGRALVRRSESASNTGQATSADPA